MNPLWAPKMNTCKKKLDWDLGFWDIYCFWNILDHGSGSKISALDPRRAFWKSWILALWDLIFSRLNSFQAWDSQVKETEVKPKNKAWTSDQNILWKVLVFVVCGFIPGFVAKHIHILYIRVAAVGSARYCIILNLAGHYPGVHFLIVCAPLKHLKTRGRNTRQPRLENIISKQVSAWTLKLVVKEKFSNIGLVQQNVQRIWHS